MLKITQLKIPVSESEKINIEDIILGVLKIKKNRLLRWKVVRRSIEARKRETLSYVYTILAAIQNEDEFLRKNRNKNITLYKEVKYSFPNNSFYLRKRPVIIGSGPAGLFCAYCLAIAGCEPIILERGETIEKRAESVNDFWKNGRLNTESNVQFGEGGAGTFSDGKLNTGISDRSGRIRFVLETFVKYGAPDEILYDANPHIGTDNLRKAVANIRNAVISLGGEFYFNTKAEDILIESKKVIGVKTAEKIFDTNVCVCAIGNSARDTFEMLYSKNIEMEPKPFAVGVRVQHTQAFINSIQWGKDAPKELGSANYKLSARLPDGRSIYTFCMCPGGYVINASSEEKRLCVNGMSYSDRASGFANSAVIISVSPSDCQKYADPNTPYPLKAVSFQRKLEENAFAAGDGKIPVQRLEDFKKNKISSGSEDGPCTKGQWRYANLRGIFPDYISESINAGIGKLGSKLRGFDSSQTLIMGVESRTSSPVRIRRGVNLQSGAEGLYLCGEGAGYAGGITSSAVDGIKAAEAIRGQNIREKT